jgi:putative transcriptional regulator
MASKRYRSEALAAVHETARGLLDAGVMGKRTMRQFDDMCLTPVAPLSAVQIRRIRLREQAS